jgi:hypothetical protein
MMTHPKMIRLLLATIIHRNHFIRADGFITRVRRATTPNFGTVNERIPGANDDVLSSMAVCSCAVVKIDECSPIPAATEAVMRLTKM